MFPPEQLTNKMEDVLRLDYQLAIEALQYENVGEIREKDQEIAALQKRYVGSHANEDKDKGITITVGIDTV